MHACMSVLAVLLLSLTHLPFSMTAALPDNLLTCSSFLSLPTLHNSQQRVSLAIGSIHEEKPSAFVYPNFILTCPILVLQLRRELLLILTV
eukprot:COSAG01_NODE_2130_length_8363_cov_5.120523_4_plen_91_part_00